jgi:hypothetical protein
MAMHPGETERAYPSLLTILEALMADKTGCGCSHAQGDGEAEKRKVENRPLVRAVPTSVKTGLVEAHIYKSGTQPMKMLLPAEEATVELIEKLRNDLPDLPRLSVEEGKGAIDIQLEDSFGNQVKRGLLLLEGPGGSVQVDIDPIPEDSAKATCLPANTRFARLLLNMAEATLLSPFENLTSFVRQSPLTVRRLAAAQPCCCKLREQQMTRSRSKSPIE